MLPKPTRTFWFWLGPAAMLAIMALADLEPGKPLVTRMAGVTAWMAVWWIAEPVPLAVTAILPLVLFPLLGLLGAKELAPLYLDQVSFLFIGGCLIAQGMERWGLNQRIGLSTVLVFGGTPKRLLLGFLLATGFLSMWMANTAAALVMIAPAMAVVQRLEARDGPEKVRPLVIALLLAVAYAASIGGLGTLVGTPTNLVFVRLVHLKFPEAPPISFLGWMRIATPLVVLMLLAAWGVLSFLYLRRLDLAPLEKEVLRDEYTKLGPSTFEQRVVLIVGEAMVFLWIFRSDIDFGAVKMLGWTTLPFLKAKMIEDATVAMFGALLLMLIPSRSEPGRPILTWDEAERLPWGIVLLFGGGFALAKGFTTTGLDHWCGDRLAQLGTLSPMWIVLCVCLALVFITEFTSNTSTVEMVLPVLAAVSLSIKVNPLFLLVPATLCASLGFMLPAGTPPNALVFGTNRLTVVQMARTGFLLNVTGAVLTTLAVLTWGRHAFGVDLLTLPSWAH